MITKMLRNICLAALVATPVLAADYPEKPVRIVVPYNAGGAVDYVGRIAAAGLSEALGENFVVENRAGASGSIGIQHVSSSVPDGYTLLMTSVTSNAITSALKPESAGYDLKTDLAAVGIVGRVPLLLVAAGNVPAENVEELIAHAKEQDVPLSYASSGVGSTEHLGAMVFAEAAGVELEHIPYTGGAPAMADVVAGRVSLMVATVPTALPQIEAGKVKPMVLALPDRVSSLPNVPSAPEAGLDTFNVASVYGLLAPAGIDTAALATLQDALSGVVTSDDFATQMSERGIVPATETPSETADTYANEVDTWRARISNIEMQ